MARVPEAAVCDTHALIHYGFGGRRLGKQAAALFEACESRAAVLYIPAIAIVECGMVLGSRRAPRSVALRDFFEGLFANPAFQSYDLGPEQVYLASESSPNRDPFDGLICAAARRLDLPLVTNDADIVRWGRVRVIW